MPNLSTAVQLFQLYVYANFSQKYMYGYRPLLSPYLDALLLLYCSGRCRIAFIIIDRTMACAYSGVISQPPRMSRKASAYRPLLHNFTILPLLLSCSLYLVYLRCPLHSFGYKEGNTKPQEWVLKSCTLKNDSI